MKYIAIIMVMVMALFGCSTMKYATTDKNNYDQSSLTVLTINLMVDMKGSTRTERIVKLVDYLSTLPEPVDVILIQEGSNTIYSGNTIDKMRLLMEKKNLYYDEYYKSCTTLVIRPFYDVLVGVLSRYHIEKYTYQNLNANSNGQLVEKFIWSKRPMVKITINHPTFGPVDLFSVHFSGLDPEKETNQLIAFALSSNTKIIGGDFNFDTTSKGYTILNSNFKATGEKIDHIFYDNRLELVYSKIIFDGKNGPVISDHFGLLAKFKLK